MRVLLDECLPKKLKRSFAGHEVKIEDPGTTCETKLRLPDTGILEAGTLRLRLGRGSQAGSLAVIHKCWGHVIFSLAGLVYNHENWS